MTSIVSVAEGADSDNMPKSAIVVLVSLLVTTGSTFSQERELTLSEAVRIALANNRNANIAKLDITKAEWQLASTKTNRYPSITTYLFGSGNITSPTFTFKQGTFGTLDGKPNPDKDIHIKLSTGLTGYTVDEIKQPLTQLYKIGLAIQEQRLEVDLSRYKYLGKRQSIAADVKQAYYAVLQTESSLEVAEAAVKQYQETDRVVTNYLAQQSVLRSSSLDVKAKLAQAQYQVIQLNNTLLTQKEKLNTLLGRDIDTPFRAQQVPPIVQEETDLKLARSTALTQRAEVKEAEIDTHRAEYDRRLAKAQYIPDIGAAFRYMTPFNTAILPQNIATAGLEMRWEPFEWGRRKDDIKQKEAIVGQTKLQLDETRSQVLLDVDNSFRKLAESRLLLAVADAARAAATEKLREVNDKFKTSAVLFRDVLEQQTAVANANNDYEDSLLAFWTAKANFEKALGEE
jgi:outer membrane protein